MKVNYDMISPKLHYLVDIICTSDASSQGEISYYNSAYSGLICARAICSHALRSYNNSLFLNEDKHFCAFKSTPKDITVLFYLRDATDWQYMSVKPSPYNYFA